MKTSKFYKKICSIVFAVLFAVLCFFCCAPVQLSANADFFSSQRQSDSNFSMELNAVGRSVSNALPLDKRQITTTIGGETLNYDYYCFKWRDIEYLRFSFNSQILNSANTFNSYQFLVTYVESENLQETFGNGTEKVLSENSISQNSFSPFDFYYYVDSDAQVNDSKERSRGYGFGLYKFDFRYTYTDEDQQTITRSIGEFYIAILPDDIDTATHSKKIQILYSVSSSNRLLNVYNLYLSSDDYDYVNPKYIEWIVVGTDLEKSSYVYSQKIKDSSIQYANYKAIWQTPPNEPYGKNFVFDSNNIEGNWTAYCIIKDSKGNEKASFSVDNLSTVKKAETSYVWLILIIVISVLVLAGIVALVVFYYKKQKVW